MTIDHLTVFVKGHWLLVCGFIAILIALIAYELQLRMGSVKPINAQKATALMNHEQGVVVDIRDSNAYSGGHILNSMNIPRTELDANITKLDTHKTKPIILVCAQGMHASAAGKSLKQQGFDTVYYLQGGIQSWRSGNLPLVKK